MNEQELRGYLIKLAEKTITDTEHKRFSDWATYCTREEYEWMLGLWEEVINEAANLEAADAQLLTSISKSLRLADGEGKIVDIATVKRSRSNWVRITAAAAVIIGISTVGFLLLKQSKLPKTNQLIVNDVSPGTGQAILKTANGHRVFLDSLVTGTVASNGTTSISKSGDQQLTYSGTSSEALVYDTIQIPAGGRPYRLILGDGSYLLLNAATTIRIPENMSNNSRGQLELITGEVYASIVHNAAAPLTIVTPFQLIKDLGTRFDVTAYPDENNKVVLEDGAVDVNNKALEPGQQAISVNKQTIIESADVEKSVAWTKGYFRFNGDGIQVIMKELTRWYNIEVIYEGAITTEGFYGKISRSKNISEVLKMLEKTKMVHFKIEGRRVTVSSKK